MEDVKEKKLHYPGEDTTDPKVLEKFTGATRRVSKVLEAAKQLTQGEREEVMRKEAEPTKFEKEVAAATGTKTAEELRAQLAAHSEYQLARMSAQMPPSLGLQTIQLHDLTPSPTNPRKRKGNIDDLIASIGKLGVLQPPLVRRIGAGFQIVFGHQRCRAAKDAGLSEVVCDVRDLSDNDVLEAQAAEQLNRTDLHELEEAEHYERMVKAGYAAETIADRIGRSKGHVIGRIKLLSLCPEARSAFYEGAFHPSVGIPLARIYPSDIQAKALHAMLRQPMTARQQIEFLQKEFSQNLKGAPFNPKDENLVPEAGSCVACPHNANNMPPTLFGDFERGIERQGLCLNTPCFGVKARAQANLVLGKAKDAGATVLSAAEARSVLKPDGGVQYKAAFVKADDVIHKDTKKRTWAQLFGSLEAADRPAMTVAPDPAHPGKTVQLFDSKEALKAARALGCKWAAGSSSVSKTPEEKADAKSQRDKERAASAKQEAVLKVTKLTVTRLAERWSKKAGLPQLRALAAELFAKRKMFDEEDQEFIFGGFNIPGAKSKKIPTERAVETWIEKEATKEELIAISLVLVCWDRWTDTADDFETQFADLAAEAGANLKEGLRAEQLTASLEAEKKAAKK